MADPRRTETERPERGTRRRSSIVERNLRALAELADAQRQAKSMQDRFAMAVSHFAGRMSFVYVHAVVFGLWVLANTGLLPGIRHFDPNLNALNTIATLEAIFLATFVLIAQNRMSENEEIRNHLDVQVSLLTEEETTHILRLVAKMGEKMGIEEANDPDIRQLIRNVETQELIEQIGKEIEASTDVNSKPRLGSIGP
ncbi:MAG TPA: DUF1003 domain-containing protein [Gemmatimonadaceae bacterium]|nr:DUF1003 domain-containing protein [Gemmatimonadaceae bacterium]